jgi:predicted esterase
MKSLILCLLMLVAMTLAVQAETLSPGTHPRTFKSALDAAEQPYNLYIPKAAEAGKPIPLVVALHGHGATWESWFAATKVREWAEQEGYAVVCPQGRGNYFYLAAGETDVFEAIADAEKLVAIDKDRIYLIGHSMGGWGTWQLACAHPDFWAGIAPMAAWAPTELLGNVEFLDPLIIHGDADEAVDVRRSRDAAGDLSRRGISHRYIELAGVGHESSMISDMLPTIGDHLRGRTRKTDPTRISQTTFTYGRGKAWWLQIREFGVPGKPATVIAEFSKGALKLSASVDSASVGNSYGGVKAFSVDLGAPVFQKVPLSGLDVTLNGESLTRVSGEDLKAGKQLLVSWDKLGQKTVPGKGESYTVQVPAWKAELKAASELGPVTSPVIGKIVTPRDQIAAKVGELGAKAYNVKGVLLSDALFLPDLPQGDVTFDALFDFLYRLEQDTVNGTRAMHGMFKVGDLQKTLADQKPWKPSWWPDARVYPEPDFSKPEEHMMILIPYLFHATDPRRSVPGMGSVQTMWQDMDLRRAVINEIVKEGKL